jgi:hypothetical protein
MHCVACVPLLALQVVLTSVYIRFYSQYAKGMAQVRFMIHESVIIYIYRYRYIMYIYIYDADVAFVCTQDHTFVLPAVVLVACGAQRAGATITRSVCMQ